MAQFQIFCQHGNLYRRNSRPLLRRKHCFYCAIFTEILQNVVVRQQGKGFYLTPKRVLSNIFSRTEISEIRS